MRSPPCQAYVTLDELVALRQSAPDPGKRAQARSSHQQSGLARSRMRGHGVEFEEIRPYTQGDDIRSIDWRLSARTGKPVTKVYAEDRDQPVFIMVDQRSTMFFGAKLAFKSVTAARMAAHLGWQAFSRRERLGGMIVAEQLYKIKIQHSQQSVLSFLAQIVEANTALNVQSRNTVSLGDTLVRCHKLLPAGTRIIVISDFIDFDETCSTALRFLARQRQVQLVMVSDSIENHMPVNGTVGISNGVSNKRLFMSDAPRKQYLLKRQQQHEELLICAAQCRSPLLCLTEKDSPGLSTGHAAHGVD
jgi:uncharacterized protein (DUF58 family)